MVNAITGIHHVTAIASDPQRNLDFYAGVLGLRLVKLTVNFDDPATYHFYYGDRLGMPGTILTFFPWPGGQRGREGTGQATSVAFSVPERSLGFWIERLLRFGIVYHQPARRFGERVLAFRDPDGLGLELVAHPGAEERAGWAGSDVPAEHALRGIHAVTLLLDGYEHTAQLLTEMMRFRPVGAEGSTFRYAAGEGGTGALVELRCAPDFWSGVVGSGTIHHVAFRAAHDEQQHAWHDEIAGVGLNVTPPLDRQYFRSIYYREPGGVLFEIATDAPGFAIDETEAELGTHLRLPPWLEPARADIERALPPLRLPRQTGERAAPPFGGGRGAGEQSPDV
jgi:catechol 2,3-dioxygenase-like lactoylglutathione lyase family enzyme